MKTTHFLLTVALLALVDNVLADKLRINDFTIAPGETKNISVELDNPSQSYIAFEFLMTLPEGVSIVLDGDDYLDVTLNNARCPRHILETAQNPDGSYHFLCYSTRNNVIKEVNGEILSIRVKADTSFEGGLVAGRIFNQKLSDPEDNKVTFDDFNFYITVNTPAPTAVTIVIPHEGIVTYCPYYGLDFSGVTGFKAYVATRYSSADTTIRMEKVDAAASGTGLLLAGTPGSYTVPCKKAMSTDASMLHGILYTSVMAGRDNGYSLLKLSTDNGTPLFVSANNSDLEDGSTAWLLLSSSVYDGGSVAIDTTEASLNGDINKDGEINISDVISLVNIILNNN